MVRATRAVVDNHFGLILVVAAFAGLWGFLLEHPVDGMPPGVLCWWSALCAISLLNIWLWRFSASMVVGQTDIDSADARFQRRQLLLSAVYVLGCAFRAFLPRADVQRLGLFDCWASSVMLGRSVATLAELCFAAQWALLVHHLARRANFRTGMIAAWLLVPLIVVAEMCSWHAALTTAYIGNALEESLWALAAALLLVSLIALWRRCSRNERPLLAAGIAFSGMYFAYMCAVDVPMYVSRWLADELQGRQYLSLSQGLWDATCRWVVTHTWEEWSREMPWMSLYFSVGVWCSLALVHARRMAGRAQMSPG